MKKGYIFKRNIFKLKMLNFYVVDLNQSDLFMLVLMVFRIIIGFKLFQVAHKTELKILYLNSVRAFLNGFVFIFLLFGIVTSLVLLINLVFTNKLFGGIERKKSPFTITFSIGFLLFVMYLYTQIME